MRILRSVHILFTLLQILCNVSIHVCFFQFIAEKLRIITPLKDTKAGEGQEIVLNCEVNTEEAKAKWMKNDETIFDSSKFIMTQKYNVYSLRIKDAEKSDAATYTITLTNQRNESVKSSAMITVQGQFYS